MLPIMERQLAAAGVGVETVTTDDNGKGRRYEKSLGCALAENGVTRWYFRKQSEFYKVSVPLRAWLQRHASRFDVVHIHALFSFTSVIAAGVCRSAGIPYIIRPLGALTRYGMTQRRAFLKRLSFGLLERSLLRDAAAVHFTSSAELQEAEVLGVPMRSIIIPLGLEPAPAGDARGFLGHYPELEESAYPSISVPYRCEKKP